MTMTMEKNLENKKLENPEEKLVDEALKLLKVLRETGEKARENIANRAYYEKVMQLKGSLEEAINKKDTREGREKMEAFLAEYERLREKQAA